MGIIFRKPSRLGACRPIVFRLASATSILYAAMPRLWGNVFAKVIEPR